jgi:hypothetical protein
LGKGVPAPAISGEVAQRQQIGEDTLLQMFP